jgi:hypothetical protein
MEFICRADEIGLDFLCAIQINCTRSRRWQSFAADKETQMFDATMIVAGLAFFVVAIAYVVACDKL